jgi:fucose permease
MTHNALPQAAVPFVRDRFTWLAYGILAYFAYLQAVIGPAMPFLRDDLELSYTVGGLHVSAMALGMVSGALIVDRAVQRIGRVVVFWGGGLGMGLGALILVAGRHPAITVSGSLVLGLLGSCLLATIQSSLSDRHADQRVLALTESNVGASVSAGLSPLLVGGFQRIGIGWRAALVLPVLLCALVFARLRTEPIPAARPVSRPADAPTRAANRLPGMFWGYWTALVLGVATEWSIVAWGADFLADSGGLHKADASLVMTAFFGAMVVGRLAGSRLTRLMDVSRLIWVANGAALVGFVLFWLSPVVFLSVAGLFIAGLGVANLYPFLLSIAVGVGKAHPDAASARVTLGAGLAILLAPQILGSMADQVGIETALGLAALLLILSQIAIGLANRLAARHNGARHSVYNS